MSVSARIFLWLYSLILFLFQPVLALYLLKRGIRQPEYRQGWGQRFLASLPEFRSVPGGQKRIWVHAVSVGEAHAISPLVQHWAKVYPQHEWAVSCTTPTGLATCRQLYSTLNQVQFFYLPYDLPYLVARTLKQVRAHSLWVVETELWPNLLLGAAKAKVHTALLNARVSPTTGRRLAQLRLLSQPVLQSVGTLIAQTQTDAAVFEKLGRPVDAVCGNLKFDVALKPELATTGRAWREATQAEQVVLFASSREGEEALLLDALNRCQFFKRMPKASVWIVPRHPQRFDEVFELMAEAATRMGVARPVRRSASFNAGSNIALAGFGQARLVLGDSMGEMPAYYSVADLALLGGSWLPFGGQNLIEACAYGCPVWMGPNTFNFAKAAEDALAARAARRFEHLLAACEFYLSGFQGFDEAKKAAFAYARGHRGATQRSFDVLNLPTQLPAADRLSEPKAD
ncbi:MULTISPECIES: 3-deoxy-D-manno-octulosonic acid transferase [unclassified Limnobacter]|uniref:3-deoxy-D-manno-octulosonic acid transferase n=1 Tax=unclassified Limnobacter TaxID=2630203 RepID=UPI000C5A7B4A|nr:MULTISPECIES: 3-deoxy-D-manno-octulosonic acid transferase [unclassified Limnobacter]MAZ08237.1 3-deoxy-D-manno-octulosonic acid transferase [Sutterellaceae bacterium]